MARRLVLLVLFSAGCATSPTEVERIEWLISALESQRADVAEDITKFNTDPAWREVVDPQMWQAMHQELGEIITYLKIRKRLLAGESPMPESSPDFRMPPDRL